MMERMGTQLTVLTVSIATKRMDATMVVDRNMVV
jgi:hypothetical protein